MEMETLGLFQHWVHGPGRVLCCDGPRIGRMFELCRPMPSRWRCEIKAVDSIAESFNTRRLWAPGVFGRGRGVSPTIQVANQCSGFAFSA